MLTVEVKGDAIIADLLKIKQKLSTANMEDLLENLALFQKFQILKRTAAGLDAEKKKFKPYSLSYKEVREQAGRPTAWVDLNFYGRMLGSMSTKRGAPGQLKAEIYFASAQEAEKARRHNEGDKASRLPKRPFFAISSEDIGALEREINDWLEEDL